jgi:hypothetical protein
MQQPQETQQLHGEEENHVRQTSQDLWESVCEGVSPWCQRHVVAKPSRLTRQLTPLARIATGCRNLRVPQCAILFLMRLWIMVLLTRLLRRRLVTFPSLLCLVWETKFWFDLDDKLRNMWQHWTYRILCFNSLISITRNQHPHHDHNTCLLYLSLSTIVHKCNQSDVVSLMQHSSYYWQYRFVS